MKKIHQKMKVLEWSQHFSHYKSMRIFQNAQRQLTQTSLVGSCRISNPIEILSLTLLPARIKKNKSKMKELEWSQDFTHYNPMGAIYCHGNQSSDPTLPKTYCNQSLTPMMLLMKFDYDWQTGFRDIYVWKCGCTDAHTDGRRLESHTISSPWAFGSGELKISCQ